MTAGELRVGVDLVGVAEVAASVAHFGDRYVRRVYTPHEIECCLQSDPPPSDRGGAERDDEAPTYSYESMAARFAAKEAALKVLRPIGARPEWRSIEVYRTESGWCELRLSGRAAAIAAEAGMDRFAVSLTHESAMGAAVVVGMGAGEQERRQTGADKTDAGRDAPRWTGEKWE